MRTRTLLAGAMLAALFSGLHRARGNAPDQVPWAVTPDAPASTNAPSTASPSANAAVATAPADADNIKANLNLSPLFPMGRRVIVSSYPSRYVLTCSYVSGWELWDLKTGVKQKQGGGKIAANPIILSPDGQFLFGYSQPGRALETWSLATGKRISSVAVAYPTESSDILGFLPGDRLLVYLTHQGANELEILNWKTGALESESPIDRNFIGEDRALSATGKYLATAMNGTVTVYATSTGKLVGKASYVSGTMRAMSVYGIAFSPDGREIAVLEQQIDKMRISVLSARTGQLLASKESAPAMGMNWSQDVLHYSPDGKAFLVNHDLVVDRATLNPVMHLPSHHALLYARWADAEHVLQIFQLRNRIMFVCVPVPKARIAAALADIAQGGKIEDAALTPATRVNLSSARTVNFDRAPAAPWAVHVPAAAPVRELFPASLTLRLVPPTPLPPGDHDHALLYTNLREGPTALLLTSAAAHTAFVERVVPDPEPPPGSPFGRLVSWVERYDLRGVMNAKFNTPTALEAIDASPSGKSVLFRGGCAVDRVEVWSQSIGGFKPVAAFRPFGPGKIVRFRDRNSDPNEIRWGALLDDNHLLALSVGNRLACFEVPAVKMLWQATVNLPRAPGYDWDNDVPALSADRTLLAIPGQSGLTLVDALSGNPVNTIVPHEKSSIHGIAFSPDGKQLAAVMVQEGYTTLNVYDLATGKTVSEVPLRSGEWFSDRLMFASPGYVMLGDLIVSLEKKTEICGYANDNRIRVSRGPTNPFDHYFYVYAPRLSMPRRPNMLVNVPLPNEEAIKAAASLSAEDLYLWHPGMTVSLSLNVVGDENYRKDQLAEWTRQLKARGIEVVDNSPNKLNVNNSILASKGTQYVTMRTHQSLTAHTYADGYRITLTAANQEIWKEAMVTPPQDQSMLFRSTIRLQIKPGESAQQAYDRIHPAPSQSSVILMPPAYIVKSRKIERFRLGEKGVETAAVVPGQPSRRRPPG